MPDQPPPRRRFRLLRWSLFGLALVGLGLVLQFCLAPQPHCVLPVGTWVHVKFLTNDGSSILTQAVDLGNGPLVQTWDTHSGKNLGSYLEKSEFNTIWKTAFSPAGRFLAVLQNDGSLSLIDLKMGNVRKSNFNLKMTNPVLTFSCRDSYLAISELPATYLVECNTEREGVLFPDGRDDQYFFAFCPDETILYMDVGVFTHWDQRAGKILYRFENVAPRMLSPDGNTVLAEKMDTDGMDNTPFFLDLSSKKSWPLNPPIDLEKIDESGFSPDRKTWITFGDGEFAFWDVATGKQRRVAKRTNLAAGVARSYSPDSATFLLDSSPEHLTLWDSASGRCLWKWDWGDDCPLGNKMGIPIRVNTRFSADSQFLFVPTYTGFEIVEARTGKKRHTIQGSDVSFSNDDRYFAFTYIPDNPQPGFMKRLLGSWWPVKSKENEPPLRVVETATGRMVARLQEPFGHWEENAIYECKGHVSNDGRTLITPHRSKDGSLSLRVWDIPLRPPLRLVIGIPLGLGLVVLLFTRWRAWRRGRATEAAVGPVTMNPEQKT